MDREDYTDGDDSGGSYKIIQAARDISTVQYKLQNATLIIPDYPVMKICPHKLMSTIYCACIAWSFFLLQQAKTCNSQKYRVTELLLCSLHVMSKLTY